MEFIEDDHLARVLDEMLISHVRWTGFLRYKVSQDVGRL
jgi:hypothetical protein